MYHNLTTTNYQLLLLISLLQSKSLERSINIVPEWIQPCILDIRSRLKFKKNFASLFGNGTFAKTNSTTLFRNRTLKKSFTNLFRNRTLTKKSSITLFRNGTLIKKVSLICSGKELQLKKDPLVWSETYILIEIPLCVCSRSPIYCVICVVDIHM